MTDGFWAAIDAQITELRTARTAADVLRILAVQGHNSPAFFAGSGGDQSVYGALSEAGWDTVWYAADYHWAMRASDGSSITYIEGDIFPGSQR